MSRRPLSTTQLCFIVALALTVHWLGMHILVHWLGGEERLAHGQTAGHTSVPAYQSDDGWRRTNHGWERIGQVRTTPAMSATHHFTLAQLWPAAWAGCVVLCICSLPVEQPGGTV